MEQNKEKTNLGQGRSYHFGLKVIRLYHTLSKQGEFILSKQLAWSGASIGANVEEALAALLHIINPPPTLHDWRLRFIRRLLNIESEKVG